MDLPAQDRLFTGPELRICRSCLTDFYGLPHPDGLCHTCRKSKMGAPTGPWNQNSAKKGKP